MTFFRSLSLLVCSLIISLTCVGCGSSGDSGDSTDGTGGGGGGGTGTTVKNFIAEPSSAAGDLGSITADRATDGTVYFHGRIGVQRYSNSQDISVTPPPKLTFRFSHDISAQVYGSSTVSRGALAVGDSLDGSSTKNGVWYYSPFFNNGYSIPTGTVVRVSIVDNGDNALGTGDELETTQTQFWTNVPLTAAPNIAPIFVTTIVVPGPG